MEDNIKMDLREVRWQDMEWADVAQDSDSWLAIVKVVLKPRLLQSEGKFTLCPGTVRF